MSPHQQLLVSLLCLMLALLLFRRACALGVHGRSGWALAPLVVVFGMFATFYLAADYFTNRGIDESVIYHLRTGLGGAGFSEYAFLIAVCVILLFVTAALTWATWGWARRHRRRAPGLMGWLAVALALGALAANPVAATIKGLFVTPSTALAFSDFYRPARPGAIAAANRRNILFVYLEGLEATYLNEAAFPGLTPNLHHWRNRGHLYADIGQTPHAGWTIAGMMASQCGLPLIAPSHGGSLFGLDRFLPGERCLGDILRDSGYRVEFQGGAKLSFSGKGKFLRSHGFHATWGRTEFERILPTGTPMNGWGLYDETLLRQVEKRLRKLDAATQPYALFTLTLDTHHPKGQLSPGCAANGYGSGDDPILNAVKCTDRLLGELLANVLEGPAPLDLLVVLASDHLAQRNTVYERLETLERRNFLLLLDSRDLTGHVHDAPGTTLDIAPVVLGHLGVDTDMGLGRNIRRRASVSRATPGFTAAIPAWRGDLERLWEFPSLAGGFSVATGPPVVLVGGRRFVAPLLIEYDRDLNSRFFFEFDGFEGSKSLRDHYRERPLDAGVAWIDWCHRMTPEVAPEDERLCVLLGQKRTGEFHRQSVDGPLHVPADRLRSVLE